MISRLLEALLTLAADDFRSRYGAEVIQVHQERAAVQRGPIQWLLFGGRELVGIVWLVVRSRLGQRHRGVGGTTTRGRGGSMVDTIGQDLRFAFRTLTRNPAFAATAVAVLALGIGANTAIFSAVNAFFFRPLPFADPDRLVMLYETNPEFGWQHAGGAPANVLDWREQVDAFQDVAMYTEHVGSFTHVREGEPELLGVTNVSGNFFSVLGVPAALGRAFEWDETWEGNDGVIILSHALWETHFGADPGVVGRTVELSGTTVEIVGVMPDGFSFPSDQTQMWSPWGWATDARDQVWFRRAHWVRPVARLAPGVSPTEADGQLQVVVHRLQTEYPETNRVMGAGLMPLRSFLVREVRMPLMVLLGAVSLLLLLACANVANLMLVRASERSREVALRHALGAGRRRVVRQFLTESLVMAFLGGTLGLGLGWAGVRAMERLTALGIDGATAIALDARVVLFTLAVALFSGVVFGLAPALNSTGSRLGEALKDGGRGGTAGRQGLRTVNLLVATEVALALLLVVGAGLMVRSFWLLRDVDPGFQVEGTLAVQLTVPSTRYAERDQVLAFYDQLTEALEGRPGIERAGTVGHLPLAGQSWSSQFQAEGWPPDRVGFEIVHRRADPGYFEALGIPLVRGRMFDSSDGPEAPLVVVVNETFAREHFPGEDPLRPAPEQPRSTRGRRGVREPRPGLGALQLDRHAYEHGAHERCARIPVRAPRDGSADSRRQRAAPRGGVADVHGSRGVHLDAAGRFRCGGARSGGGGRLRCHCPGGPKAYPGDRDPHGPRGRGARRAFDAAPAGAPSGGARIGRGTGRDAPDHPGAHDPPLRRGTYRPGHAGRGRGAARGRGAPGLLRAGATSHTGGPGQVAPGRIADVSRPGPVASPSSRPPGPGASAPAARATGLAPGPS